MLALALIGLLAAPVPEAQPRVPGMRFRLGMAESRVLALGSFPEVKVRDAGAMTARQGPARFFGVPGEATCYIGDGVLARVRFVATGVSRHSQDYVDGQLRRIGLERACRRDAPGDRACDWTGPAVRVTTEMGKDGLTALIERWPPPEADEDSLPGAGAAAARAAKPPAAAARIPPATGAPAATRPPAAPREAGATARPAPSAAAPARRDSAGVVPTVVTLPETLTISLTSRNAPDVWPRIVSSPPLDYPESAKRESIQGVVWVMALVEPDGRVSDAWIERSILELDTAALGWVSRSRFVPCARNGRPCRFYVRVAVRFTLY